MIPGPKRKGVPHGHVARSIARKKRPFLTVTIDPTTYRDLDSLASSLAASRGAIVDLAIASLLASLTPTSPVQAPEGSSPTVDANDRENAS